MRRCCAVWSSLLAALLPLSVLQHTAVHLQPSQQQGRCSNERSCLSARRRASWGPEQRWDPPACRAGAKQAATASSGGGGRRRTRALTAAGAAAPRLPPAAAGCASSSLRLSSPAAPQQHAAAQAAVAPAGAAAAALPVPQHAEPGAGERCGNWHALRPPVAACAHTTSTQPAHAQPLLLHPPRRRRPRASSSACSGTAPCAARCCCCCPPSWRPTVCGRCRAWRRGGAAAAPAAPSRSCCRSWTPHGCRLRCDALAAFWVLLAWLPA